MNNQLIIRRLDAIGIMCHRITRVLTDARIIGVGPVLSECSFSFQGVQGGLSDAFTAELRLFDPQAPGEIKHYALRKAFENNYLTSDIEEYKYSEITPDVSVENNRLIMRLVFTAAGVSAPVVNETPHTSHEAKRLELDATVDLRHVTVRKKAILHYLGQLIPCVPSTEHNAEIYADLLTAIDALASDAETYLYNLEVETVIARQRLEKLQAKGETDVSKDNN